MTTEPNIPTPLALVDRAKAMIPTLGERSAHCEQLRRIPDETIDDFRQAGFFRISQPGRFEGYDYGINVIADVAMEVGRGCGSSAWMAGQWPGHQFMVSHFSEQAQQEYWGVNPDTLSSTASAVARLNMEPERGGWRVRDTQMRFSSGCDAAEWILLLTRHGNSLVPKSNFRVLDDWYVAGLRGTGSKSVVIEDAWIPPHRHVATEDLMKGTTPGTALSSNPHVHAPFVLVVNQLLLASTIGMARGVLDQFEERVTKRMDLHTGKKASEGAGAQLRFAESSAEVEAAMMFIARNTETLAEWGRRGRGADLAEKTALRRDTTYAARLCVHSTQRLMSAGDASGMFDSQKVGRLGRDVQMAGLQLALTWDEPARSFSMTRWGVPGPISNATG